jgi:heptosyltransferase-2
MSREGGRPIPHSAVRVPHPAAPRLTLVRAGGLGDTILLLPALQWLHDRLPAARVTLVGSAWAEALRPLLPFALDLLPFDSPRLAPLFARGAAADVPASFTAADLVVVYTADPHSAFVENLRAAGARLRVWPVAPPAGRHAALHLLAPLGGQPLPDPGACPRPALQVAPALASWARAWIAERLGPVTPVAVHPGSGGRRKCWPAAHFASLARRLASPLLLLEGPADGAASAELRRLLGDGTPVAVAAGLRIPELAALVGASAAYVGNDSGVTHLAAALGVPTAAVFGPTDPLVWGPLGARVAVVRPAGGVGWPDPGEVLAALRGVRECR